MPTIQDEDQDTRDEQLSHAHNPSQDNFRRLADYENRAKPSFNNTNRGDDNSQQRVARDEKRALNDTAAGKAAVNTAATVASAAATPFAGKIVKALGKIKTKKVGVGAGVIGVIIGTILLIGGFGGPGLLLVHFSEILTQKFDTQFASLDRRMGRMYQNKLDETTKGLCTTSVSLRCRYSTMSDKEIERFKKAGITVNYDETTRFRNRAKPTSFEFHNPETGKNTVVRANDFNSVRRANPHFRLMLRSAYNPRFVGYSDFIFKKVAGFYNINKRKTMSGDTDADRAKHMSDTTKSGVDADGTPQRITDPDTQTKPDGTPYTPEEIERINSAADFADQVTTGGAGGAFKRALSGASNAISVTGWADALCGVYGSVKAVGYAAKVIRAAQIVRYVWFFHNIASQIKDGSEGGADPDDVAYLATVLTTTKRNEAGEITTRAATDSYGYKYAAYGDVGRLPDRALPYLAGGGMGGQLTGLMATLNSSLGGAPNKTCGFVRNPWVSGVGLAAGIALMLIPGVNVAWSAKTAVVAAGNVALELAIAFLPALLQDIVAGTIVDPADPPVGEDAGNLAASGAAQLAGTTAQYGGNAPMTHEQAVAFEYLRGEITAAYAEEERLARSPFDPSSQYTLVGSVVASILPSMNSFTSVASGLSSLTSLASRSVAQLSPSAKAITEEQYRLSLGICDDAEYTDIYGDGSNVPIAVTPFCNVIYGMPPPWLNSSVTEPLDHIIGQYDEETGAPLPGSAYETFVNDCILRTAPLGGALDPDQQGSNGAECVGNDVNKWYYLAWMDRRVGFTQDEDEAETDTAELPPVQQNPTIPGSNNWANPNDNRIINSVYGGVYYQSRYKLPHKGVDLQNRMNEPVYSACDGVILHIIREGSSQTYGEFTRSNTIVVDCGYDEAEQANITTGYHHTYPVPGIREGMPVTARTLIGRSDCSGLCSGAHLHFNVRINGYFDDPVPFMSARGVNLGTCRQGNPYCV